MRDTFEIFALADHGQQWTDWLAGVFGRVYAALHWAGAAFTASGQWRAG